MSDTLGTQTDHGIVERIRSNGLERCLYCGVGITDDNDSGWEAFTEISGGRRTQKVCKICDERLNQSAEKAKP